MGLLDQLLDPGFRQAASVLVEVGQSKSELGDLAMLISEIEVQVGRVEAASATITIDDRRDTDGTWMASDSGLFARWEPIVISADFQTHIEEVFRGYITELKPTFPQNGGEAKLVVTCQDSSVALSREHMRRVWGDEDTPISDRDILIELLSPLPLSASSGPDGQSSRALSQDGTPIVFLKERAKANGFELIFNGEDVYFGPMQLEGEPQSTIMVYAGSATNCLNFSVTDDAQKADSVVYELAPREEGDEPVVNEVGPDLPLLAAEPAAAEGSGLGTPSVARIKGEGDETEEEVAARAVGVANENSFRVKASGELDGALYGHVLRVGKLVKVDGVGTRNGGIYYVDSVAHKFTQDGYRQNFQLIRNGVGETDALGTPPLSNVISAISSLF